MNARDRVLEVLTDDRLEPHLHLAALLVLVILAGLLLRWLGL